MTAPMDPVDFARMLGAEPNNSRLHATAALLWIFQGDLKRAQKSLEDISPETLVQVATSAQKLSDMATSTEVWIREMTDRNDEPPGEG